MKVVLICFLLGGCSVSCIYLTSATNATQIQNNPAIWTEEGLWGPLLQEWALGGSYREKRVMQLTPMQGAFIMNEGTNKSDADDKEAKVTPGRITTKPPGRQVSETDLYLLAAIEKLVFRVDFMEKRLRKVEEMLYYVTAGNRIDHEPCPENFSRIRMNCYLFHSLAGREFDWKVASNYCKRIGATLAEMESIEEAQDVVAYIQNTHHLRGKDFWLGGLNPGLLWIWSNSARPVINLGNNKTKHPAVSIPGEGRCLRLAYEPALRSYAYRGTDCSVRYSYVCEIQDDTSSNEITKIGRSRKIFDEF